jgi:hypothetical protein
VNRKVTDGWRQIKGIFLEDGVPATGGGVKGLYWLTMFLLLKAVLNLHGHVNNWRIHHG